MDPGIQGQCIPVAATATTINSNGENAYTSTNNVFILVSVLFGLKIKNTRACTVHLC